MKRIVFLFSVLILCLSLFACGDNIESTLTTNSNNSITESTPTSECSHDYKIADTVASTCSEFGKIVYNCTKCAHRYQVDQPKVSHIFVEATCVAPKTCTQCGATEGDCIAHKPGQWVPVVESTPTTPGQAQQKCAVCDAVIGEMEIPAGSYGLAYTVNPDGITCQITGIGFCGSSELYIPERIDGYWVTAIGNKAFYSCRSLESVYIPESVAHIGECAFGNCSNLVSVRIPDSVTTIYYSAFNGCSSLENVILSGSVTSVDASTFADCSKIKYNEYDNAKYLGTDSNPYAILIQASNTDITSCNIHENTRVIASSAFQKCDVLASINIPDSVIYIGNCAFEYCKSITDIHIPGNITSIQSQTFHGCVNLTNVQISNGVTSIQSNAFMDCDSLTHIDLPNSVTFIGGYVFVDCDSLQTVTIPDNGIYMDTSVFADCGNLQYNTYDTGLYLGNSENPYLCLIGFTSYDVSSCIVHEDTRNICNDVRHHYRELQYNTYDAAQYLGTASNPYAFLIKTNSGLTSCDIHEDTRFISPYAFAGQEKLTSISIPDGVHTLGYSAFWYCSSLSSVSIGRGIEVLPAHAFQGCDLLTDVIIAGDVKVIGPGAFNKCSSLTSITIPYSVTKLEEYAFYCCANLTEIIFMGTMEQWNAIEKGLNWDTYTRNYTVYCTDGEIYK